MISTAGLFFFHVHMIMSNKSSLEMEALAFYNPFHQGKKSNWAQIFGENKVTWFIPVDPQQTVDGLDYPVTISKDIMEEMV
jgi:hypothetical protein